MRHLGIAAHSMEGALLCLRTFAQHGFAELGPHMHPDVSLDCVAMARSMSAWDAGDHRVIRSVLELSITRLADGGADFFVCPDNTAHLALEACGNDFRIPGLHIAEVTSEKARMAGYRKVGILGTRYTMQAPMYAGALAAHGIDSVTPSPEDQDVINRIIFTELVNGSFREESFAFFQRIIEGMEGRGCDAVALVCTEIPLLIDMGPVALPTLDSTRLLARAAFDVAVGSDPLPAWRGGKPSGA